MSITQKNSCQWQSGQFFINAENNKGEEEGDERA